MKQISRYALIALFGVVGWCWLAADAIAQDQSVREVDRTWVAPTKSDPDGSATRQAQLRLQAAHNKYMSLVSQRSPNDPELAQAAAAFKLAKAELNSYTGYWIETVPDDNRNQYDDDDSDDDSDDDWDGGGQPFGTESFSYLIDAQKEPLVSRGPLRGTGTFDLTVDPSVGTRRINLVVRGRVVDPKGVAVANAKVLVTVENTPQVITSHPDGSYQASFPMNGYADRVIRAADLILRPPCLYVDPSVIHFGPVAPNQSLERRIEVINTCDFFLEIEWDKLVAGPGNAFVLRWDDRHSGASGGSGYIHGSRSRNANLGPDIRLPMIVTFTPTVPRNYSGEVSVAEKEPSGPYHQVSFFGSAGGITVVPNQVDFGIVKELGLASSIIKITNIATTPITIQLRLEGMRNDFDILSVNNQPHLAGPVNIQAGATIDVVLMCSPKPGPEAIRSAVLVVGSSTAGVPQTRVELSVMAER